MTSFQEVWLFWCFRRCRSGGKSSVYIMYIFYFEIFVRMYFFFFCLLSIWLWHVLYDFRVILQISQSNAGCGFIFSFYFTFNLLNVHTLNVIHLFCYLSITYKKKNVQGRFFLRDATQQPLPSLSLSLSQQWK